MNTEWHPCEYKNSKLQHDGTWEDGKWYQWLTKDGEIVAARMKEDTYDHFFPSEKIDESDVVAFREYDKEKVEKIKMLLDVFAGEAGLKLLDFEKENLIKLLNTPPKN